MPRRLALSLSDLDLFPRVPTEFLREPTSLGSLLSFVSLSILLVLAGIETYAFLTPPLDSRLFLDRDADTQIRIVFNISMLELNCDYAVVDVKDSLGLNRANATVVNEKWRIGPDGHRLDDQPVHLVKRLEEATPRGYMETLFQRIHKTAQAKRVSNGIPKTPDNLDLKGDDEFTAALEKKTFLFAFFYAPRCPFCAQMMPEWDDLAVRSISKSHGMEDVTIAKVDCTVSVNRRICKEQSIRGVPTIRLFKNGRWDRPDYRGLHRQVKQWLAFLGQRGASHEVELTEKEADNPDHVVGAYSPDDEHVGCQMIGEVVVNRVPGNFHIEARKLRRGHSLQAEYVNLSHVVNNLYFGEELKPKLRQKIEQLPPELGTLAPVDDMVFVPAKDHQVYHHYIKAVPSEYNFNSKSFLRSFVHLLFGFKSRRAPIETYQIHAQHAIINYNQTEIPEAKFNYDVHPVGIQVVDGGHYWYEYLTTLLGVVGGAIAVIRVIFTLLDNASQALKQSRAFGVGTPTAYLFQQKITSPVEPPSLSSPGEQPKRKYMVDGKETSSETVQSPSG